MTHDPLPTDETDAEPAGRAGMSQNGQMLCIGAYCGLVLVGFVFGVVAGYESPKTVVVTKAPKEKEREAPRPAPKVAPPAPQPKEEAKPDPKEEPAPEPKKEEPKPVEPPKPEVKKEPEPTVVAVSFQKDVLPIFRSYSCLECHGSPKQDYGIDLRTHAAIMKGGEKGAILVPKDPDKSSVFTSVEDNSMPKNKKDKVPAAQQLVIKNWILGGAKPRRRPVRRR